MNCNRKSVEIISKHSFLLDCIVYLNTFNLTRKTYFNMFDMAVHDVYKYHKVSDYFVKRLDNGR